MPDRPATQAFLPIDSIVINEHLLTGDQITSDIDHDIASGTVTVTFCDVRDVQVNYKHHEATR